MFPFDDVIMSYPLDHWTLNGIPSQWSSRFCAMFYSPEWTIFFLWWFTLYSLLFLIAKILSISHVYVAATRAIFWLQWNGFSVLIITVCLQKVHFILSHKSKVDFSEVWEATSSQLLKMSDIPLQWCHMRAMASQITCITRTIVTVTSCSR